MNELNRFVDLCIIDEYATQDFREGWSLDVQDIPDDALVDFLKLMLTSDTRLRDIVLHDMQALINKRIIDREVSARYEIRNPNYLEAHA